VGLVTDAAGKYVQHSHYLPYHDRSRPLTIDENGGPAAPESIGCMASAASSTPTPPTQRPLARSGAGSFPGAGPVGTDQPGRRR
jgi:hypothetical protein